MCKGRFTNVLLKQAVYIFDIIKRIILIKLQVGYCTKLVSYADAEFIFYLILMTLYLLQQGLFFFRPENAQVNT